MNAPLITRARSGDAEVLTQIAFAAKRSWGYPEAWIQRWSESLTITERYVDEHALFIVWVGNAIAGFAAVERTTIHSDGRIGFRLEHLWIRPAVTRRGLGTALFAACENAARSEGATILLIESDPHAELFYQRMGAVAVGYHTADMDGVQRKLPQMEKRW